MSESEPTTRKRSSSRSGAKAASEGKIVETYEDGLEAGYIGGPIDEADHTVAGEIAAAEAAKSEEASSE